ncbi:medium-chain acyl-CoA ligase ACSF2, mitochondrial-like [Glandiceps talaboti]
MAYTTRRLTKSYFHRPGKAVFCGRTFSQLFDEHATLYPDHEALVFCEDNTRISYSKLMRDTLTLSHGYMSLSSQQGDRIGLWLDESYEFIISNMAAIRSGLIPALIPLKVTREQLCYIVNKVKCTALIVGSDQYDILLEICPELKGNVSTCFHLNKLPTLRHVLVTHSKSPKADVLITDLKSLMSDGIPTEMSCIEADPDDVCFIAFTSGSTGLPKAVAISHRAIIEGSKVAGDLLIPATDGKGEQHVKVVVSEPFTSVVLVIKITLLAMNLMTVIIPKNKEAATILETIQQERVTTAYLWPDQVFEIMQMQNIYKYDLSSLLKCVVSGSVISIQLLRMLTEVLPTIMNFYGSTESVFISFHSFDETQESQTSTVGIPVDNVEVKIVKGCTITDINTPGELCVRSPYIFTCYWDDEEKTKDVKTSSGWYHTGDIGTMDETGCLRILGRKDDMIIKGAFNIYPAEIEHQLVGYPGVKYVQVVPVPDKKFGNEICLCLCADLSAQSETEDERHTKVLDYLRDRVPDFHLPKYVLTFNAFPFTQSGKIQRNELATAASERLELSPNIRS